MKNPKKIFLLLSIAGAFFQNVFAQKANQKLDPIAVHLHIAKDFLNRTAKLKNASSSDFVVSASTLSVQKNGALGIDAPLWELPLQTTSLKDGWIDFDAKSFPRIRAGLVFIKDQKGKVILWSFIRPSWNDLDLTFNSTAQRVTDLAVAIGTKPKGASAFGQTSGDMLLGLMFLLPTPGTKDYDQTVKLLATPAFAQAEKRESTFKKSGMTNDELVAVDYSDWDMLFYRGYWKNKTGEDLVSMLRFYNGSKAVITEKIKRTVKKNSEQQIKNFLVDFSTWEKVLKKSSKNVSMRLNCVKRTNEVVQSISDDRSFGEALNEMRELYWTMCSALMLEQADAIKSVDSQLEMLAKDLTAAGKDTAKIKNKVTEAVQAIRKSTGPMKNKSAFDKNYAKLKGEEF